MTTATRPLRKWTVPELDALYAELQAWLSAQGDKPYTAERYTIILQFISDLSENTPEWYGDTETEVFIARMREAIA